jgi:hypothetical protein
LQAAKNEVVIVSFTVEGKSLRCQGVYEGNAQNAQRIAAVTTVTDINRNTKATRPNVDKVEKVPDDMRVWVPFYN